jgi:hypothetical protein
MQNTKYSGDYILTVVEADQNFVHSKIPSEFIWSYLYISSPLANLQHNIDHRYTLEKTDKNMLLFLSNEFLFDFISKRIDKMLNTERAMCSRFAESMTVGSVYANSYVYFGWTGLIMMAAYILFVPILYLGLIRKSNTFYVTATSILGSLYLFLIFDNMFTFTGLSFQLVYPLFMNIFFAKTPLDEDAVVSNEITDSNA